VRCEGGVQDMTAWPAFSKVETRMFRARDMGGIGFTTPSDFITAKHSLVFWTSSSFSLRHGISCTIGSYSHGFCARKAWVMSFREAAFVARGPTTERMLFWPSMEFAMPSYGRRPVEGRRP
jgi:hypothetical protein